MRFSHDFQVMSAPSRTYAQAIQARASGTIERIHGFWIRDSPMRDEGFSSSHHPWRLPAFC
jgi:hypothetical protein